MGHRAVLATAPPSAHVDLSRPIATVNDRAALPTDYAQREGGDATRIEPWRRRPERGRILAHARLQDGQAPEREPARPAVPSEEGWTIAAEQRIGAGPYVVVLRAHERSGVLRGSIAIGDGSPVMLGPGSLRVLGRHVAELHAAIDANVQGRRPPGGR